MLNKTKNNINLQSVENINNHLEKFKDIDTLLEQASHLVDKYFEDSEIEDREEFKKSLKKDLELYASFFDENITLEDKAELFLVIDEIEAKYNELIYFWEWYNWYENLRKLREQETKGKPNVKRWSTKKSFSNKILNILRR